MGTIGHVEEVLKSVLAIEPIQQARDKICELITNARTIETDPWSALLLRTVWTLLEDRPQKSDECLQEWRSKTRLSKFTRREDRAFSKFGLTSSMFLLSSLLEFGAMDTQGTSISLLRRLLQANLDRLAQFDSDGISRVAQLSPKGKKHSLRAIERASGLVFKIFGIVLDHGENESTHLMIHAFLAFLTNAADSSNCLRYFGRFVPWPKVVTFLNGLWSRNRGIAETACRQVLPEDAEMPDLIFYAKIYLDQFSPYSDVSVIESPLMQRCRELRMLDYGYHLANYGKWLSYNGTAFEVIPALGLSSSIIGT